jgi:hypothetical protein
MSIETKVDLLDYTLLLKKKTPKHIEFRYISSISKLSIKFVPAPEAPIHASVYISFL